MELLPSSQLTKTGRAVEKAVVSRLVSLGSMLFKKRRAESQPAMIDAKITDFASAQVRQETEGASDAKD